MEGARMVRKLLMLGGAVALLFGLLLYAILAGLILGSTRDAALHAVLRSVSNALQGDLEVIEALRLSYNLLSLLRLRLTVHEIDIVHPRFTLMEEPDGILNISRAFASSQPRKPDTPKDPAAGFALPIGIVVENLRLRDGEMVLGLSALPGVRQVTALQLQLEAQLDAQSIQARLHQMTADTSPAQVDIHALHGAFQSVAGAMRVDGLRLEVGHTVLTADGALPHAQQPADFTLRIDPLDVAEIGRLLPAAGVPTGPAPSRSERRRATRGAGRKRGAEPNRRGCQGGGDGSQRGQPGSGAAPVSGPNGHQSSGPDSDPQ
jgi:hypothetical protein